MDEKENETIKNIFEELKNSYYSLFQPLRTRIEQFERNYEEIKRKNERNKEEIIRRLNQLEQDLEGNEENFGIEKNNYSHLLETKIEKNKLNEENKRCIICYEDFQDNNNVIFLPCFHIFHSICIKTWLNKKDNCPLCKLNINSNL